MKLGRFLSLSILMFCSSSFIVSAQDAAKELFPPQEVKMSLSRWHEFFVLDAQPFLMPQSDDALQTPVWNQERQETELSLGLFVDLVKGGKAHDQNFSLALKSTHPDTSLVVRSPFFGSDEFVDDSKKIWLRTGDKWIAVGKYRKPQRHRELETWLHPQLCDGVYAKVCSLSLLMFKDSEHHSQFRFEYQLKLLQQEKTFVWESPPKKDLQEALHFPGLVPAPGDLCVRPQTRALMCKEQGNDEVFFMSYAEKIRFWCRCR